jgi:hypothetical protein
LNRIKIDRIKADRIKSITDPSRKSCWNQSRIELELWLRFHQHVAASALQRKKTMQKTLTINGFWHTIFRELTAVDAIETKFLKKISVKNYLVNGLTVTFSPTVHYLDIRNCI